jgi:hypothetical protein
MVPGSPGHKVCPYLKKTQTSSARIVAQVVQCLHNNQEALRTSPSNGKIKINEHIIKYPGINPIKEVKDFYYEKYKTLRN